MLTPCYLQLIPKKPVHGDAIFVNTIDFSKRSPLIGVVAEGPTQAEIKENSLACLIASIGKDLLKKFAVFGSPMNVTPDWDRCFVVEDWGAPRGDGMLPVIRAVVYAPTPELAEWQARSAIADRRKKINLWLDRAGERPATMAHEIKFLPPLNLGEVTTVHDFTGADGGIVAKIHWALQLGAFRFVHRRSIRGLKGAARKAFRDGVREKIANAKSRDELLAQVTHTDQRLRLEGQEASIKAIARASYTEEICDEVIGGVTAKRLRKDESGLFPFLSHHHAHLMTKVSENVVVFGSVEPANMSDLDRVIQDKGVTVFHHKDRGDA